MEKVRVQMLSDEFNGRNYPENVGESFRNTEEIIKEMFSYDERSNPEFYDKEVPSKILDVFQPSYNYYFPD